MVRLLHMERLPYIDSHSKTISAPPERVWTALLSTLRRQLNHELPQLVVAVWGLEQSTQRGDWRNEVRVGDTITGFAVAAADPTRELTLRGRHRFSSYELRFHLEPTPSGCVELHANTSAAFPGRRGRLYRSLVIGSRGHRLVVRRMLSATARRAER